MMSLHALYSIGDLHLGGESGFQIFGQGALLAATIRALADHRPAERVALVLDGDVFDTLAGRTAAHLQVETALDVVGRILADPAFSLVFDALGEFVRPGTPSHRLKDEVAHTIRRSRRALHKRATTTRSASSCAWGRLHIDRKTRLRT